MLQIRKTLTVLTAALVTMALIFAVGCSRTGEEAVIDDTPTTIKVVAENDKESKGAQKAAKHISHKSDIYFVV